MLIRQCLIILSIATLFLVSCSSIKQVKSENKIVNDVFSTYVDSVWSASMNPWSRESFFDALNYVIGQDGIYHLQNSVLTSPNFSGYILFAGDFLHGEHHDIPVDIFEEHKDSTLTRHGMMFSGLNGEKVGFRSAYECSEIEVKTVQALFNSGDRQMNQAAGLILFYIKDGKIARGNVVLYPQEELIFNLNY